MLIAKALRKSLFDVLQHYYRLIMRSHAALYFTSVVICSLSCAQPKPATKDTASEATPQTTSYDSLKARLERAAADSSKPKTLMEFLNSLHGPGWHYYEYKANIPDSAAQIAITLFEPDPPLEGVTEVNLGFARKKSGELISISLNGGFFEGPRNSTIILSVASDASSARQIKAKTQRVAAVIEDTAAFLALVRRSKTLLVTADVERLGSYTMEFDVRDFKW